MSCTKVYVKPKSKHAEYIQWEVKTITSDFVFTLNTKTKLFTGERTGSNEYSGMGRIECQRVIDELGLVLEGME